ncbi:MAG: nicotinate-nucleotide adenylyltransferase [Gammaproteobacteria bacterium]
MIGIYGGTFDPVHYGHLRPALEVYEDFALSELRFVPCGQPPHRRAPQASPAQRLAMVERAIAGLPGFIADDREIRRGGTSYMIDTLRSLQAEAGGQSLCLILGVDAFAAFHTWHDWQDIPRLCNLLIMHRPEFEPGQVIKDVALKQLVNDRQVHDRAQFRNSHSGKLIFYPVTQLDISSTRIRAAISQGRNIRFLLPDAVISVIEQEGIYQ